MLIRSRLAACALLTAATYLGATLTCTAPATAQPAEPGPEPTPPPTEPGSTYRPTTPVAPAAPPEAGGILADDALDPTQYVVGSGDLFGLMFWGGANFSYRLRVDAQGRLFVPNVGFIEVRGLTLAAADALVGQRVRAAYPRLKHGLVLLAPRSFMVQVAGLVRRPEAYQVTALTRVSAAINKAGGRLPGATQRRIEIRRRGKVLIADLQPFYQDGDRRTNPYLLEGDVVFVKAATREIMIEGAVHQPGLYELVGDGTLGELLGLAGGVTPEASSRLGVRVLRRVPGSDEIAQGVLAPVRDRGVGDTVLKHGDRVVVPGVSEAQRTIVVAGAVGGRERILPGADKLVDSAGGTQREITLAVPFFSGDTVRTVLERAGGLMPWADARNASVERRDAKGQSTRVPVDAYALLVLRDVTTDIPVKAGDVIYVPAERESIMVAGPVHRPGLYQYNPRYKAVDYINLAGGPTPQGAVDGSKVIKKDGTQLKLDQALTVAPGDTVSVKVKTLTTFEWVQILLTISSVLLSGTAIAITIHNSSSGS